MKKIFSNDKIGIWELNNGNDTIQLELNSDGSIMLRDDNSSIFLSKANVNVINYVIKESTIEDIHE